MGYRTVVILENDEQENWMYYPELGKKIAAAKYARNRLFDGGSVVECVHADEQTLAILDSYHFYPLASSHWDSHESTNDIKLKMLEAAAKELGYTLTRNA